MVQGNNRLRYRNIMPQIKPLPLMYSLASHVGIDLSHLKFISDQGIKTIARNCSKLKSLIIEKCDHVTDESINEVS